MKHFIDINSDVGEGFGVYSIANDDRILKEITSANIACGFHAGDPRIMNTTMSKALNYGVGIGAHPSFPDLVGFGRRDMNLTPLEVETDVLYQLGALNAFAKAHNSELQHVSPHGRLGNLSVKNENYAEAIVKAVTRFNKDLIVITEPGKLSEVSKSYGLKTAIEIFADRAYNEDGTLVSRKFSNSVIEDVETVLERCERMVLEKKVKTVNGNIIDIDGQTLCVHGDTNNAIELVKKIKETLIEKGVTIKKLRDWL